MWLCILEHFPFFLSFLFILPYRAQVIASYSRAFFFLLLFFFCILHVLCLDRTQFDQSLCLNISQKLP